MELSNHDITKLLFKFPLCVVWIRLCWLFSYASDVVVFTFSLKVDVNSYGSLFIILTIEFLACNENCFGMHRSVSSPGFGLASKMFELLRSSPMRNLYFSCYGSQKFKTFALIPCEILCISH